MFFPHADRDVEMGRDIALEQKDVVPSWMFGEL